jgi:hypothetical protein
MSGCYSGENCWQEIRNLIEEAIKYDDTDFFVYRDEVGYYLFSILQAKNKMLTGDSTPGSMPYRSEDSFTEIQKQTFQMIGNFLSGLEKLKEPYKDQIKIFLNQINRNFNMSGGKSTRTTMDYKKTNTKVTVGKRECVVYEGKRGGKYVRMNKEYMPLKKALQSSNSKN